MKTVIELAREAGCGHESIDSRWVMPKNLERFAALVREDCIINRFRFSPEDAKTIEAAFERAIEKQQDHSEQDLNMVQKPVAWTDNIGGFVDYESPDYHYPLYTTPPTAALAARQMRDALVHISEYWNRDENETAMADALWHIIETADNAIAALPVPEVPLPKTLDGGYELCEDEGCPNRDIVHYCKSVPEVQWRDFTEVAELLDTVWLMHEHLKLQPYYTEHHNIYDKASAVIAKFKEKQL